MAHLDKYTLREMKGISKEAYRELQEDHYKNFVNPTETKNNFSYNCTSSNDVMKAIKKRILDILEGEDPKSNAKIGSWVITCPKELKDDARNVKLFFDTTKEFLENRYGKKNIIDVIVHLDETTPHCTCYVVPEAVSRKSGKRTVSTASCFTRKDLQSFHKDFDTCIERVFHKKGLVNNKITKENRDIEELKRDTYDELKKQNIFLIERLEYEKGRNDELQREIDLLRAEKALKAQRASQGLQRRQTEIYIREGDGGLQDDRQRP